MGSGQTGSGMGIGTVIDGPQVSEPERISSVTERRAKRWPI